MSAAISTGSWAPYSQTPDRSAYGYSTMATPSTGFGLPNQRLISQYIASESASSLATSDGSASAPRRRRVSRPKVRTGCITCKIRRIKCDEKKPSCMRCTSTGRKCDGYAFLKQGSSEPPPHLVSPPPKRAAVPYTSLILPHSLTEPFQGSIQEKRIFHRFQLLTVPAFSGGSESGFWRSLALQVGQQEVVVRNAIIALGSLHEDYQIRGGKYEGVELSKDDSYRAVNILYNKALRQLSERLSSPDKINSRLAIICSILFACFDVLRRRNMDAVVHYQLGMRELMRQMSLPEADSTAVAEYNAGQSYKFRTIPSSELEELMRVFCRYDIQACTFSKPYAETVSIEPPTEFPAEFTLAQVRSHLDSLLICIYQLAKSDRSMFRYWNKADVPLSWQQYHQDALAKFQNWLEKIEVFFDHTGPALSQYDSKALLGLRLQVRVALIMLQMSIDCKAETLYDQFTGDFEYIVSRAEQLFQSMALVDAKPLDLENANEFTMELGLVHPLFFVATKCRDWNLRRRAVAQLRKAGKEGVWEGPVMAILASKIMKLEEQGVTRGTLVPERNRFHEIRKNVLYDERQISFEAHKPLDTTYTNWHIHRDQVSF